MGKYAQGTSVPIDRSRSEIEKVLRRYGADQFVYGWSKEHENSVGFRFNGRKILFRVPLPRWEEFQETPTGLCRPDAAIEKMVAQGERQRWRALLLVIKAKLEAVDAGITSFEDEFLANTLLPSGVTVGEWSYHHIEQAISAGEMPPLLPAKAGER